ncbi:MAG: polyribonucleotide nucleotidyltransferase [Candidatus Pacebacteria bacterium]|nr:polyribonucleotide nucleotidyltransferase [Candidatus Paceibacterota bacterium]
MEVKNFKKEFAGRELIVEAGRLAGQANGSVTVKYGDTMVLATATMSGKAREGINYFPLMVDYEERVYAAGKIKGSRFIKRDGRPTDKAVVTGRVIDRIIRPLFPSRMRNDIQMVITVLSVDQQNDPLICAIVGASVALGISDIPWDGPVGVATIAKIGDKLMINATYEEEEKADVDLIVAGTGDKINMIEGEGKETIEEEIIDGIKLSQKCIEELVDFQKIIIKELEQPKTKPILIEAPEEVERSIKEFINDKLPSVIYECDKKKKASKKDELEESLKNYLKEKYSEKDIESGKYFQVIGIIMDEEIDKIVHQGILKEDRRPDGRRLDEVRSISAEVGILPRTHGSGLFNRGETQVLSVLTLGSPGDEQLLDSMEEDGVKRFMHHYTFPGFSVGEVKPMRGPSRRDIGHGNLAEKALESFMPDKEKFPYTIRLVSEVLSSNGSSSMASVCGSSLALMDSGVPIPRAVAGIAMGLMTDENNNYKVLTDIQGYEDHYGDMDLKVAGTEKGITAIQMDVKIKGATLEILKEAFEAARQARLHIIEEMNRTISSSREDLSKYAPRITTLRIDPEKIKDVIGPGGKMINEIIAETGVAIDIEDDGLVMITSKDSKAAAKAEEWIKNLTREVVAGEIFQGKVVKIMDFGAFVEILPGQDGLVHISELAPTRVEKVEDIVKIGDVIAVKVKEIDSQGRINLTHKGV